MSEEMDFGLIKTLDSKLMKSRCRAVTNNPFMGTILARFKWKADPSVPTMGVAIIDGEVCCWYNEEFCDEFEVEELIPILYHEIEHIIKLHPTRTGTRDPELWNIACDMIVNAKKQHPNIPDLILTENKMKKNNMKLAAKLKAEGKKYNPKLEDPNTDAIIWMPNAIPDSITTEEMYEKLLEDPSMIPDMGGFDEMEGDGEGQEKEGDGSGKDDDKDGDKNGKGGGGGNKEKKNKPRARGFDTHEMWRKSNASEEEARQIVKELVKAGQRAGNAPNHLQQDIKKLAESKVNWRNIFKELVAREVGGKRLTYSRLNRKLHDPFGVKGKSSHARIKITVIVDTSGSVDDNRLKQFFTEIDKISQQCIITVMPFTCFAGKHFRYRKGDWRKTTVKDRGGTSFQAAFDALTERKLWSPTLNVVLTDGECGIPPKPQFPIIWCLCTHSGDSRDWKKTIGYGGYVEIPRDGI